MGPDTASTLTFAILVLQVVYSTSIINHSKPILAYEPRNHTGAYNFQLINSYASHSPQKAMLFETGRTADTDKCSFPEDPSVNFGLDQAFGSSNLNTVFISIPVTSFSCHNRPTGYYADRDTRTSCRVFHYCNEGETVISFICPSCTLFHEEKQLCDYWYNVECYPTDEETSDIIY